MGQPPAPEPWRSPDQRPTEQPAWSSPGGTTPTGQPPAPASANPFAAPAGPTWGQQPAGPQPWGQPAGPQAWGQQPTTAPQAWGQQPPATPQAWGQQPPATPASWGQQPAAAPIAPGPPAFSQPSGQSMYGNRPDQAAPQPAQAAFGPGGFGQFTFPTPPKEKVEPLAVAGVATSPLGPVGIALGLLARNRVRQTRRRSMRLAWTGVALGALFTVAWALTASVLTLNGSIERALESPQPGDVTTATTIASANLAVGNCVATLPPGEQVGDVRLVPCAEEHAAQVVSLHQMSGAFPGPQELADQATAACTDDVGALDAGDVTVVPWFFAPSQAGWEQGNTQVVCLARTGAGPLTVDLVN